MKTAFLIVLFLVLSTPGLAQSPVDVFRDSNRFYQEGRYPEARTGYESLLANGYESVDLYLNLGNACFRMGDIARAVLNYERGLRLAPTDEDLQFNLDLASMMTVDRIAATPRLFVWDYWDGIKSAFSMHGIFWATYAAWVVLFFFLSVLILGGSFAVRRVALFGSIGTGAVFLVLLLVAFSRNADLSRTDQAVIMSSIVSVKNAPDSGSTDAFVLHAGTRVQITDTVGGWMQIRLADGKVGWVESAVAEVI
jgi:tetratricopeptide (TPR) repeat protein